MTGNTLEFKKESFLLDLTWCNALTLRCISCCLYLSLFDLRQRFVYEMTSSSDSTLPIKKTRFWTLSFQSLASFSYYPWSEGSTLEVVHCPVSLQQQLSNFAPSAAPEFRLYPGISVKRCIHVQSSNRGVWIHNQTVAYLELRVDGICFINKRYCFYCLFNTFLYIQMSFFHCIVFYPTVLHLICWQCGNSFLT